MKIKYFRNIICFSMKYLYSIILKDITMNEIACVSMLANWIILIYSDCVNDRFIHGPAKGPIFLRNSTKNIQDKGIKNNSIFFGIKWVETINAIQKRVKYRDNAK